MIRYMGTKIIISEPTKNIINQAVLRALQPDETTGGSLLPQFGHTKALELILFSQSGQSTIPITFSLLYQI